ncbi:hypothetical protein LCGC14_2081730, partial [marine sediment metagenome]
DWPVANFEHQPTDTVDLFVRYDDRTKQDMMGSRMEPVTTSAGPQQTPHPRGMSGGGIWLFSYHIRPSSGVMQPNPQLIGLQCGFVTKRKLLRGVLVGCWLTLVERHYPELAGHVSCLRAKRLPATR